MRQWVAPGLAGSWRVRINFAAPALVAVGVLAACSGVGSGTTSATATVSRTTAQPTPTYTVPSGPAPTSSAFASLDAQMCGDFILTTVAVQRETVSFLLIGVRSDAGVLSASPGLAGGTREYGLASRMYPGVVTACTDRRDATVATVVSGLAQDEPSVYLVP